MDIRKIPYVSIQPPSGKERITKAAVRLGDDVYTGFRHADIMRYMIAEGLTEYIDQDQQGFVDSIGSFYNRYQSARIAARCRQIPYRQLRKVLTSEDLWNYEGQPVEYDTEPD